MKQYLDFLGHILSHGEQRPDRTGTGVLSHFGCEMRFDLEQGFPLVTTKKIHLKSLVHELLWFLRGETNIRYLNDHGVTIWDEWADESGELGPIYGKQWRAWQAAAPSADKKGRIIDQMATLLDQIRNNPSSRRLIISAWNVGELDDMALPPCHLLFQFYVSANQQLSCKLTQRSADAFLGVPFNIASYALLTHIIAQQCDLGVGQLIWSGGDCHIYNNHLAQVHQQRLREPFPLPTLRIRRKPAALSDYIFEDFDFVDYQYHPAIRAPIAV